MTARENNGEDFLPDRLNHSNNSSDNHLLHDNPSSPHSCVWIGIDFGTTHSAAVVWESTRGRPKWLRLGESAFREGGRQKAGRLVPSVILLASTRVNESFVNVTDMLLLPQQISDKMEMYACVGAPALQFLEDSRNVVLGSYGSVANDTSYSEQQVSDALVISLKRQLLSWYDDSSHNKNDDMPPTIPVTPLGCTEPVNFDAVRLLAVILSALLRESVTYLSSRQALRKHIKAPSSKLRSDCPVCRCAAMKEANLPSIVSGADSTTATITNCHAVFGIPAQCQTKNHNHQQHDTYQYSLEKASKLAGYASISVVVESTAAAMAYGITLSSSDASNQKTILVFDMGGGTTDVTIAVYGEENSAVVNKEQGLWQVKIIDGAALGGDDLDQLLLEFVVARLKQFAEADCISNAPLSPFSLLDHQKRDLLRQCRRVKEELCGNSDETSRQPLNVAHVIIQGQRIPITQTDLQIVLEPWLARAEEIVQDAMRRFGSCNEIHEVILVGGSSRVPAVRTMLQSLFPTIELCLSVHPMSAVAQGAAIQAAVESNLVPMHELKSAMMLDTLPYAIGILTATIDNTFVELLARNAVLPAKGYATFQLGSISQPGITFQVVECIDDAVDESSEISAAKIVYQPIQEFTFLLHRLTSVQLERLSDGKRFVEVGMIMRQSGELVCSLYDPNDPEHVAKRAKVEGNDATLPLSSNQDALGYKPTDGIGFTKEQILLLILGGIVLVLYVAVKVMFADERVMEMINQRQTI
jgi:molecular chaperone DnaK (HSP70)